MKFYFKKIPFFVFIFCISCNTGRSAFRDYYDSLIRKNPEQAKRYLSNSCKKKLVRNLMNNDTNQVVQSTLMEDFKSYVIGKSKMLGDTLFLTVKITVKDGRVYDFDKGQEFQTVSGRKIVEDFRYRLYKEGNQWKIDLPYCRNTQ